MPSIPTLPSAAGTPHGALVAASASRDGSAVRVAGDAPSDDRFARASALLGFDDPDRFLPRRAAVLSGLKAASLLTPSQLRTLLRVQYPLAFRHHDGGVSLGSELKAAFGCLREEARLHGRLVALGQAWAGANQLAGLVTAGQPAIVTRVAASAVAGEVLCRLLDDLDGRSVFSDEDELLVRRAWRAAHPPPAYFRRR